MANWISIGGKLYPGKEYAVNPDAQPGEPAVYEGPCRAAMAELKKQGVEFLGGDCRTNPDMRLLARSFGYSGADAVEKFLEEMYNIKYPAMIAKGEKNLKEIVDTHKPVKRRKKSTKQASGGDDTSGGGKHKKGGFGEPAEISGGQSK